MSVPEVDVDEFAEHHAAGARVVDVREADEYAAGHVPGAVSVPLTTVVDRVAEFGGDGPTFVICHVGSRSRRAAEFVAASGVDVVNVAGGTFAWIQSGRGVVTGDEPGDRSR